MEELILLQLQVTWDKGRKMVMLYFYTNRCSGNFVSRITEANFVVEVFAVFISICFLPVPFYTVFFFCN